MLALVAAATAFAALAAQPPYQAARAAVVAEYGPIEARTLADHVRESPAAERKRLAEELMRLQERTLDRASARADQNRRSHVGDFPRLPRHARLD